MADLPIRFQQLLELTSLGINANSINFTNLTLQSDKFICIRETIEGQAAANVIVIDMKQPTLPTRRPISADSAVMNPVEQIIALKAGQTLQVFNLAAKARIKGYSAPEPVLYWKWISNTMLAYVTARSVFHWDVADEKADPVKMFDRLPNLNDHQIINYHVDGSGKWLCLVGIAQVQARVAGNMQLYSVERKVSQPIEGHAASFAEYQVPGAPKPTTLFCFATRTPAQSKFFVIEVGKNETDSGPKFQRKATDIFFPPEAAADFPVAMEIAPKYQIVYLITKMGYLHMFDMISGSLIFMNKICQDKDTIFATCPHAETHGLMGVNRRGQVLLVSVNEQNIVPYLTSKGEIEAARQLASRAGLPGADDLFLKQFQILFQQGRFQDAARVAAESPNGFLRTIQTIRLFQAAQGTPAPVLQYFSVLLEKNKLNKMETLELARPVLAQGKKDLLEQWINQDKLEYCEELGDEIRKAGDLKLALTVFLKANARDKIVVILAETGQFQQLVQWCAQQNYTPDWMRLLTVLLASNTAGAVNLAKLLLTAEGGPLVDRNAVVDAFVSRNLIKDMTSLLLDVLNGDKADDGPLQTKLLELNLLQAPLVADAILGNEMFKHYNRKLVAERAEQAGLFHRALEHYTELSDWKRVLRSAHAIQNQDWLAAWFGQLSNEQRFACMNEMLASNLQQNLGAVVKVCVRWVEQLTPGAVIKMFESYKSHQGIYMFLHEIIELSQDADVHFKYIEAAARLGQISEVERIVRQSNSYEPERVRDFLKEAKLSDQLPLVIVCDRFNFVDDLIHYLYKNNMVKYIEPYVTTINPTNTPIVVGALLDEDAPEDFIMKLINITGNLCPVDQLVEEVEKRNRLKLLQQWLETRFRDGNQEPALHNALAKIFVDAHTNAEAFLTQNKFYDSKVVGKYCENRDPHLAFVAYRRGVCDKELIEVTNKHSLFKHQARYLIERQQPQLWAFVLSSEENQKYRRELVEAVHAALPETKDPVEVSSTVTAFMAANLPNELIELLEKLILDNPNSDFGRSKNLQNLLIVTAIRAHSDAHKSRVMDYIRRCDLFEAGEIAEIAIENGLFEEAFSIYTKFKLNSQAAGVLLDKIKDLTRAAEFAEKVQTPDVYVRLGKAQLAAGEVAACISSFLKANDPADYPEVIEAARSAGLFEELVKFLKMARTKVREPRVDSELAYSLAKNPKLESELVDFISSPNCANIQDIGDRCYDEGNFKSAKLLYNSISNFSKLALAEMKLGDFAAAVEAARKANSTTTWKEVNKACVEAGQFRLAQVAGVALIVHADELDGVIRYYEQRGHFDEITALIESGLGLDRAHGGMYTELAILYSKHKPAKLMEHLNLFAKQATGMNLTKVANACEKNQQWKELTYIQIQDKEVDRAVQTMIAHSVDAWDHILFKETIAKVNNKDNCYKAIKFYLEEHPTLISDLLQTVAAKVDHTAVVTLVRELGHLPLIKAYLTKVQDANVPAVNEALNALYIEEDDFDSLRHSIETYHNFDALELARKLEKHELIELRRIAAVLYKQNGKFAKSIDLCKDNKLFQDAAKCAADSDDVEVAENLLKYFVDQKNPHAFAAALFTCYHLVRPDVVLELAWRHKVIDFAMPYIVQVMREWSEKINKLSAAEEQRAKAAALGAPLGTVIPGVAVDPHTAAMMTVAAAGGFPQNPILTNMGGVPPMLPPGAFPPGAMPPGLGTNPNAGFGPGLVQPPPFGM